MKNSKIDPTSALYKRAVKREGNFWKGQTDDPANPTHLPQSLLDYKRECETGNAKLDRFAYLKTLGKFKQGLSIGCGSGNFEVELLKQGIVDEFTFIDISAESLENLRKSLPTKLRKRTRILQQDMNFIELKDKYDFIFCANVLHHLINLEHILLEMNNALTTDGILVIDDFIGENRFQFSEKRIKRINATAALAGKKTKIRYKELIRTGRKSLINSCPFEAIRSEDLYKLLHQLHGKQIIRESTYGGVSSWMNVVISFDIKDTAGRNRLESAAKIFVAEDKKGRKNKEFSALYIFAVYKKNPKPPVWNVKPWSKKELAHHLPVSMFDEGIVLKMGNTLRAAIGEGKVYTTIKNLYLKMRS